MSIPTRVTIKQVILIGGTVAFILWIAYEMAKRYPITHSSLAPSSEQIRFN